jgi:chitinase
MIILSRWDSPGKQSIGCNMVSPDDSANFLVFLQDLRAAIGLNKTISVGVPDFPWVDSDGTSLKNVSANAKVIPSYYGWSQLSCE